MRMRCLLYLAMAPAVGLIGLAWSPAAAQDAGPVCTPDRAKCPLSPGYQKCPLPPASTSAPIGSPLATSLSGLYFQPDTSGAIPLLGQSYEYLCHLCQPSRDQTSLNQSNDAYCTLNTFPSLFSTMSTNRNNVIRLEAIFNHSPGHKVAPCCAPFQDEQPFTRTSGQWNLTSDPTKLNGQYLADLDAVVNAAAKKNIVVEVTLFNPWDGDWKTGPFNSSNTAGGQGFTDRKYFVSFSGTGLWVDVGQNIAARAAQATALQAVVIQLKKYPNVIWEVANEPDFIPPDVTGLLQKDIFSWEQWVISKIIAVDHPRHDLTRSTHLIQINGHYKDPGTGVSTFAWEKNPNENFNPTGTAESTHYAFNNNDQNANPGYFGAIELMRATDSTIVTGRATTPVGFNEDIPVPDVLHGTDRADDAVRSEALEFVMNGGARFDGYSTDYQHSSAVKVGQQLGYLANLLVPQDTVGVEFFDQMKPTDCNKTGAWCSGITPWGHGDEGACTNSGALLYYSTLQQSEFYSGRNRGDYLLYVHHGVRLPFLHDGYRAIPCMIGATPGYQFGFNGSPVLKYSVPVVGCYQEYWQDPSSGLALAFTRVDRTASQVNQFLPTVLNPAYKQDVVLFVQLLFEGSCSSAPLVTSKFTKSCTGPGLSCTFDDRSSTPSASITGYGWNWGDGTPPVSSGTPGVTTHIFPKRGTYVVSLEVSDSSTPGDVSFSSQQVTVTRNHANPSFVATCNQLGCTFDGSYSTPGDAAISMYSWSFGDAAGDPDATATAHTYAGGGTYSVALTVTDEDGVMASTIQTVTVVGPPIANFISTCSVLTCGFDASSTTSDSPIVTYAWTFGDGTLGSGVAPSHTYGGGGTFTVTLTATDSNGQSGVATSTVTVDAPPTASFTVACVNRTCTVHTTSSDSDATPVSRWLWDWGDGSPTIEPTTPYRWADQTYTYAHSGRYTITHTVYDTAGQSGSLQLAVLANTPPVAVNDGATTERDLPVIIYVLANDSDADGDPLSIASVNMQNYPGASWQVVPSGNSWALKVTPPDNFVGTMTFTYVAADQWGASSTATVTLTVTQTMVVLEALDQQFWCQQNGSIRIPKASLLAVDYDSTAGVTLGIIGFDTSMLSGTLDCTTDPTACTFTPPINAYGVTLFRYTVAELPPAAGRQDTGTVRIYVGTYGQAPTANDVYFTTTRNTPKVFTIQDVVQNDVDPDGDSLSMALQSGPTAYGSLICSTPMYTCTYTPNPGFVGTDRFLYAASDGIYPPVTATINILTLPPTTPAFDAREDVIVTGVNQSTYFSSGLLSNDYLPNGGPETVTGLDTTGLLGTLSCDSFGCTYNPPFNFQGATAFKYTASDGHGATDTAIVKIKVGVTNHPPVAVPQTLSTPKNTALRFSVFDLMRNDYDPDDDPLTVTVYAFPHLGSLSCGTPNYWCVYTPNANATGADVMTYLLSDGTTSVTSTVTINITP
jgi:PKD repeat protein